MSEQGKSHATSMNDHGKNEVILFWGCFFALIATAFGFIVRAQIIVDWETQFNLSEQQKGEILGVGLDLGEPASTLLMFRQASKASGSDCRA